MYRKGSHSTYDLKYHIIWCPKYRKSVLKGAVGERCRSLIREICKTYYVHIISGHVRPDHIHILVSIPANLSVSKFMQYVKGKTSRKLMMDFGHLKKAFWGRHLWARGYFAVTVGDLNEDAVKDYIEKQDVEQKEDNFKVTE